MSIHINYSEEAKELYANGLKISEIVNFLKNKYSLKDSNENIRGRVRTALGKHQSISKHEALEKECIKQGIPIEDVNYYWHKGANFSINATNNNNHKQAFDEYVNSVREAVSNSFKWDKIKYTSKSNHNLFMPNIFDLHLGKLCHRDETGEDYDIKI